MCLLLLSSGCSGDADAPATVGPTAGADPEPSYQPTIPPYTSAVELSEEDREQVDELMLLVDEWVYFSTGLSEEQIQTGRKIQANMSEELINLHEDFASDIQSQGKNIVGSIRIISSVVDLFIPEKEASLALCYEYDHWGVVDNETGEPDEGSFPNEVHHRIGVVTADHTEGRWVLQEIGYQGSDCSDL